MRIEIIDYKAVGKTLGPAIEPDIRHLELVQGLYPKRHSASDRQIPKSLRAIANKLFGAMQWSGGNISNTDFRLLTKQL